MTRSSTYRLVSLALLAVLFACGGSSEEVETPAPVEAEILPAAEPEPEPEPEAAPEPEPEPEPTNMDLAVAAASAGDFAEARRLFGEAATEEGVSPEQFAEAEAMIAMLYAVLPDEPDLEGIQLRLDEARNASSETARLEVTAIQRLLDTIRERDETVRRLTELIGNEID